MIKKTLRFGTALATLMAFGCAQSYAGGFFSQFPPATSSPTTGNAATIPLTGNEDVPADTNLSQGANPQTETITLNQLTGFAGASGAGPNFIIGGKADSNLWQRGTTGSSKTTTVGYGTTGGPDRWVYWSGTNTAMTVTKATTAAALPTFGSVNTFRMSRTASQTGVVQMCMAQEILSSNTLYIQGHTVLLDLYVRAGSNFSGTGMTAYIITGTGTDEGTTNLAFGLNAGGGGSSAWTGQANAAAAVIPLTASTSQNVAAVANIPANATEAAVALCYTPTGTAGASNSDALFFDNIELRKMDGLSGFANATAGYVLSGTNNYDGFGSVISTASASTSIPAYVATDFTTEALRQYYYYYQLNEPAANAPVGMGVYYTATECDVVIPFPVAMRVAPTLTFVGTTPSASTYAVINSVGGATPQALATDFLTASGVTPVSTVSAGHLEATTATVTTAGLSCELVGAGGGANLQWSSEL